MKLFNNKHIFAGSTILLSLSLLSACQLNSNNPAVELPGDVTRYKLSFSTPEKGRQKVLTELSRQYLNHRLIALGQNETEVKAEEIDGETTLSLKITEDIRGTLTQRLSQPLDLALMEQVPLEQADIVLVEELGFKRTGFSTEDIIWATTQSEGQQQTNVTLQLTPAGAKKIRQLKTTDQSDFRLFIRGLPMVVLKPTEALQGNYLHLTEISSLELGELFADDINIGRYITFTLIK